ncbi:hypothetical protein [Photobacterium phosphoreum]|nr:hypothetical protein [Photobacterium phosphoreum]
MENKYKLILGLIPFIFMINTSTVQAADNVFDIHAGADLWNTKTKQNKI